MRIHIEENLRHYNTVLGQLILGHLISGNN